MPTQDMLSAALSYADNGWLVFPITPSKKTPLSILAPKGFKNATASEDKIREWWKAFPNANIGLSLQASGLVCVDVDSYKHDCAFEDFIKDKKIPQTLIQRSASGGTHYIFKASDNKQYPGKLCKGVDVKYRGYILLSPSVFNNGEYSWQNEMPPAIAPEWLSKPVPASRAVATPSGWLEALGAEGLFLEIEEQGWHNTILKLVASMVAKQKDDASIHALTDVLTTKDHSVAETRREVQKMIDGARRKQFGSDLPSVSQKGVIETHRGNIVSNYHNVFVTLFDRSP